MTKVNILGTEYTIEVKKYAEDEAFERRSIDGYCDHCQKKIVVCDMTDNHHKPMQQWSWLIRSTHQCKTDP